MNLWTRIFTLALLLSTSAHAVTANKVWRASGGGTPSWGAINLASGNAVSGVLAKGYGGLGIDASGLTIPSTGTLATLAGTETFTNKTFGSFFDVVTNDSVVANPVAGSRRIQSLSNGTLISTDSTGAGITIGGSPPYALSSSSGAAYNVNTANVTTFTVMTPFTANLVATAGRVVEIYVVPDGSANSMIFGCDGNAQTIENLRCVYRVMRGATEVGRFELRHEARYSTASSQNVSFQGPRLLAVDTGASGAVTYTIQAATVATGVLAQGSYAKLYVVQR